MAKRQDVLASYSKLNLAILEVLKTEGYILSYKHKPDERIINVYLKYVDRKPVLQDVKRISKPGRRVYLGKTALPWVLDGTGIALISTPLGIMTDRQARKKGVGGEVMAYVW